MEGVVGATVEGVLVVVAATGSDAVPRASESTQPLTDTTSTNNADLVLRSRVTTWEH